MLTRDCRLGGIQITDLPRYFERVHGRVPIDSLKASWLIYGKGFRQTWLRGFVKRGFDIIVTAVLLPIALPIMVVMAFLISLDGGTPIIYRQERVGRRGQRFTLLKFRSMRIDAEHDGQARWASNDDERNTRIGRFIRRTRLDELPQLFNVLLGEMSFVGPRPERPHFVDMLSREVRYYDVRHCVKPGLTGWAQLRYPYGASVGDAEEKLTFDLFYVKNHGLVFDLMILLQTVEAVLFHRGAR